MHDFWFFIHKEGFLKYFRKPSFVIIEYGQQDLNLHGLPLEPKSSASANSAMPTNTLTVYHFVSCVSILFIILQK